LSDHRKSVCLVTSGLVEANLRLQPWRYLHEVALQLAGQGHHVTVVSDGGEPESLLATVDGVRVQRIPTVSAPRWSANWPLRRSIEQLSPDVVLWHVGLTSFLHQRLEGWAGAPVVGILTSPIYQRHELTRLGLGRIARGYRLSAVHVLGTLMPKRSLRRCMNGGMLDRLVVQTSATRQRLLEQGLRAEQVQVVAPGVDPIWGTFDGADDATRSQLGYGPSDTVILYFGSPAPLRGLHTLIRALEIGRRSDPTLKLLVLSRRRAEELLREDAGLGQLLNDSAIGAHVKVVSGFLDETALVRHVAACDVVALPFEVIPSDAPLSLLEAQALGKPVVTTTVGCLAELVAQGRSYLAAPADPHSLAQALCRAGRHLRTTTLMRVVERPARSWQQMGEEWSRIIQSL
jgi:glycosyltransferase involved in cell wall biosynthesis